jgi:hypothetical protein
MKTDIVIIGAVAAILGVLFMNNNSFSTYEQPITPSVSPNVIQVIIETLQKQEPWLQPVETIYITPKSGTQSGITYDARLMFLDTRGFFGVQYDVAASVSPAGLVQILSKTSSSSPDPSGPFQSYSPDKYQSYDDINRSLNDQLTSALAASRQLPAKEVPF